MKHKIYLLTLTICLSSFVVGCKAIQRRVYRPGETIKEFFKHVEAGNVDEARKLVSESFGQFQDMEGFRRYVARDSESIKNGGGMEWVRIDKERITGEVAKVDITVKTRKYPELQVQYDMGWGADGTEWRILGWIYPNDK